jgi:putative transposase
MADLFKSKYRISSARLQDWNYRSPGMYFVTICAFNKELFFGDIRHSEMVLTDIGNVAEQEWLKIPSLRPDMNLELGEYVIMPNHMHGIIIIGDNIYNQEYLGGKDTVQNVGSGRDAMHCVSTMAQLPKNKFEPQKKNLASIIRGYKAAVTTYARKNYIPFQWQSRFHDHIIRSKESYERIANYIVNNPANWRIDKFWR